MSHCELCEVYLPTQQVLLDHQKGKKHQSRLKFKQTREEKAGRSVYLYGFRGHSITSDQLADFFASEFGAPEAKVSLDCVKGTFAIVEFTDSATAKEVIERRKFKLAGQGVLAKECLVPAASVKPNTEPEKSEGPDRSAELLLALENQPSVAAQFEVLAETLQLDEANKAKRQEIASKLQTALSPYLPEGTSVQLVGSSMTGLGQLGADLDLTLLTPHYVHNPADDALARTTSHLLTCQVTDLKDQNRVTSPELHLMSAHDRVKLVARILNVARKLEQLPVADHRVIFGRRCPLVQFVWDHKLLCDLSVNNHFSLNNSNWLRLICSKEPRFVQLVFAVRFWAKMHGFSGKGPARHLISNYTLTLMAVVVCQNKGILPTLVQETTAQHPGNWDLSFPKEWQSTSDETVELLVKAFFSFYSTTVFKDQIICPRSGTLVSASQLSSLIPSDRLDNFLHRFINVQDPFVLDHNTAAGVAVKIAHKFKRQLMRAAKITQSPVFTQTIQHPFGLSLLFDTDGRTSANGVHHSPSDLDYVLIVDASKQELDALQQQSIEDARMVWSQKAAQVVLRLLEEILLFRVTAAEEEEPQKKRAKMEGVSRSYSVHARTWEGRRHARREICKEQSDFWTIELETTKLLVADKMADSAPILSFSAEFFPDDRHAQLLVSLRCLTTEQQPQFRNLAHFLEGFVKYAVPKLVPK